MAFVKLLAGLEPVVAAGVPSGLLERRYGIPVQLRSDRVEAIPDAAAWLEAASSPHTSGDTARMAQRLLDDFRRGVLGPIALELPVVDPVAVPSMEPEPVQHHEPLPEPVA
jgi:ribosome biogenesis GTPase A